jgi:hypothetical protein
LFSVAFVLIRSLSQHISLVGSCWFLYYCSQQHILEEEEEEEFVDLFFLWSSSTRGGGGACGELDVQLQVAVQNVVEVLGSSCDVYTLLLEEGWCQACQS